MADASTRWRFWIDVGGTFTDCVAVGPDGRWRQRKVLSSAAVKGVAVRNGERSWRDLSRAEPHGFWNGAVFRLLKSDGGTAAESNVVSSRAGELELAESLPADLTDSHRYELLAGVEAPLLAIHLELGLPLSATIPPCDVRLGTTRGTNALLTRRGARVGLVTTRGFADLWAIGYQNRPRLFDLTIVKPPALYAAVVEVDERVAADGSVLVELDESAAREALTSLRAQSIDSLAICLLHAYRNPRHELVLERVAREVGFQSISMSHAVASVIKAVPRGDTTLVNAYLNPIVRQYIDRIAGQLPGSDLKLMTSSGGLVSPNAFEGHQSVLSGPAGGVVGFAQVSGVGAPASDAPSAIGFDMGGTSTDVARFDGEFARQYEVEKAGVRIVTPMLAIETIAAGGGSICDFDGAMLTVGPQSAGADPGPACYGRDGPLTVTDINLFLGRLLPERFPFELDRPAVERRLDELSQRIAVASGKRYAREELASGFLTIANAQMAAAVRSISVAKGYDPRESVLVPFGAAGPQHACAVADQLGMTSILSHPWAGVLSAVGIGLAPVVRHHARHIGAIDSEESRVHLEKVFSDLEHETRGQLACENIPIANVKWVRRVDIRYQGTELPLTVPYGVDFAMQFAEEHQRLYGYVRSDRQLEVVTARIEAIARIDATIEAATASAVQREALPCGARPMWHRDKWIEAAVFERLRLLPGDLIRGPAIVGEELSTTLVDEGWIAEVLTAGVMKLRRAVPVAAFAENVAAPHGELATRYSGGDPIARQLCNQRFSAIAEQMGLALRNTATSVNVRERLDFSCAIFTATGDLVANAPHVPVHLGAMGETVKAVLADNPVLAAGDVIVTNDPFRGGSHLPDITVVSPVFAGDDSGPSRLRFFVANRAHHAELGGITPGSMPPHSKSLAEEGVLIRNFKLFDRHQPRYDRLELLLRGGKWPSRNVADNLADVAAQVAANRYGERAIAAWIAEQSWPRIEAGMRDIQQAAESKTRQALAKLPTGSRSFVDHLDDGSAIAVTLTLRDTTSVKPLTVDFTGTSPVVAGNLNANRAIVTSAVLYVLRCLLAEEIPLNQGVLAPVEIVLPECLLNPPANNDPERCAAVVGGNVETSQRVVDVLLGAFGVAAASQGTMNNFLFGDETFGYYETICGGSGATSFGQGADGVHTHMTNTRITDPEVLESRFPVRVREFGIRRGSGGKGKNRGGNGVVREIEFLQAVTVSLLTQRRGPYAPYGIAGGESGELGRNILIRADGTSQVLPGIVQLSVTAGERIRIETPGGGASGEW